MYDSFSSWTLETIRKSGSSFSWMEENRFEWTPLVSQMIGKLLNTETLIIVTDLQREWFESYLLTNLNKNNTQRPLLPIVSLKSLYPNVDKLRSSEELSLVDDMLCLSFPQGYSFFYIGRGDSPRAHIVKNKDDSIMWIYDEKRDNALSLKDNDDLKDIKLLQLFSLFDRSLDAILFGEAEI